MGNSTQLAMSIQRYMLAAFQLPDDHQPSVIGYKLLPEIACIKVVNDYLYFGHVLLYFHVRNSKGSLNATDTVKQSNLLVIN